MSNKDLVLVTGAAGFIGSNLTEELVNRGYKVRVLIRKNESTQNIKELMEKNKIEVVIGDLLDKSSLRKAADNIETVFHLAAKADLAVDDYQPYYQTNVIGTKNLVESCPKKLKKFVFYSSILATGLPNSKESLNESYIGKPKHVYGKSKKEAEDYLIKEYKLRGFPVTILRPTTVYGPKEITVQYYLFKVIKEGKFFQIGNGKNLMSYVFVKNLVDATISAALSPRSVGQIYYINDRSPYEYKDIIKNIYKVMDKKLPNYYIPYYLAYFGAFIFSLICKIINIKPLIYPSRVNTMVLNYAYSVKKAIKDFGYNPKYNLEQGIKETYLWYKNNGYL